MRTSELSGDRQMSTYEQVVFLGACAKDEDFTDDDVMQVFLGTEISEEADLTLALAYLSEYRPGVLDKLARQLQLPGS